MTVYHTLNMQLLLRDDRPLTCIAGKTHSSTVSPDSPPALGVLLQRVCTSKEAVTGSLAMYMLAYIIGTLTLLP